MATLMIDFSRRKKTKEEIQEEKRIRSFFQNNPKLRDNSKIDKYHYWISGLGCNDFEMPMHQMAPGGFRWRYGEKGGLFYAFIIVDQNDRLLDISLEVLENEILKDGIEIKPEYYKKYNPSYYKVIIVPFELNRTYTENHCPIKLHPDGYNTKEIIEYCKNKEKKEKAI